MSGEQFGSATSFGSSNPAPVSGTSLFSSARPAQSSFPWTPATQPEKVQQQPVHDGTSCGFCGKTNIKGTRFKCLQCFCEFQVRISLRNSVSRTRAFELTVPDHGLAAYDRCEACMAAPRAWAAHDRAHHFFPIINPGDLGDYHIVRTGAPAGPIHHGITCDGCKQNIVGAWHRCLVCDGVYMVYGMCRHRMLVAHDCAVRLRLLRGVHWRRETARGTPRGASLLPYQRSFVWQIDIRDHAERLPCNSERHLRYEPVSCRDKLRYVQTESTHRCPVQVSRLHRWVAYVVSVDTDYETDGVLDFDLCAHCFSSPTLRKTHSLKHVFFPVTTPGDLSQFNQALAIRHMQ